MKEKLSKKEQKELLSEIDFVKKDIKKFQAKLPEGSHWAKPLADLWERTNRAEKHLKLKLV